jgi:hypothetical protein
MEIWKCRYEIQEQKEIPVWYTGIYRPISSTGNNRITRQFYMLGILKAKHAFR